MAEEGEEDESKKKLERATEVVPVDEESAAQLAKAQMMQALGELANSVALDLTDVLDPILNRASLLLSKYSPNDPIFHDIMYIKQNANRAASFVRHLLAFSRRQTLHPEIFKFTDVVFELSTLLVRLLGEKIKLDIKNDKNLWVVDADPRQFEQIIVNLAVNARDAMPQGGRLLISMSNISREASRSLGDPTIPRADYVMLEISDTGIGIDPEILPKIFDPFFSTKEKGKSAGLGLSVVYGVIKQSDGFILCHSELSKGTTFRVLLPRAKAKSTGRLYAQSANFDRQDEEVRKDVGSVKHLDPIEKNVEEAPNLNHKKDVERILRSDFARSIIANARILIFHSSILIQLVQSEIDRIKSNPANDPDTVEEQLSEIAKLRDSLKAVEETKKAVEAFEEGKVTEKIIINAFRRFGEAISTWLRGYAPKHIENVTQLSIVVSATAFISLTGANPTYGLLVSGAVVARDPVIAMLKAWGEKLTAK